jgi:DNA-binding MarR family transcriptional regulator
MAPLRIDPVAEARRHWEERWGAEPSRPMAAVTSIMRAQQVLMARLNDLVRPHGLTFPRYEALVLLSYTRHGELPIGKLGERLQVHRTSASSIVAALADDGLVQRVPSERDGRATLAVITDAGRAAARAATEDLNRADFGIGALAPAEQEALTDVLRTLRLDAGDFVAYHGETTDMRNSS